MGIRERAKAAGGSHLHEAMAILDEARTKSSSAIVFFSGGKDSLTVADMASRVFDRLVLVFMYFVPGMSFCDEMLRAGGERFKAEVRQYPHWVLSDCLRKRIYCKVHWSATGYTSIRPTEAEQELLNERQIPEIGLRDIYNLAKADTGIPVILHGAKRCDSTWRRRNMQSTEHWTDVYYPIASWNKHDVLSYLSTRGIKPPASESTKAAINGVDLVEASLCWLHEQHPDDFKKLCEVFPYAPAAVWRRRWYGAEGS